MAWFPLGPDFTFTPNDSAPWTRLSRRNEGGSQATVDAIAVDPSHSPAQTIYALSTPWPGGSSALRTDDGGESWTSIVDDLAAVRFEVVAPTAIALNPATPATVYLGWSDGGFTVSTNKGEPGTWSAVTFVDGSITQLLVDPTTASSATPTIYACTSQGLFVSQTGGATWTNITVDQHGNPYVDTLGGGGAPAADSLIADFSGSTPIFYAALRDNGVVYSTNPIADGWTSLCLMNIGLPNVTTNSNVTMARLGLCPNNPSRLYAYFLYPYVADQFDQGTTYAIFTTDAPTTAWTQVNCPTLPGGYTQGTYTFSFAVCPNSPGDGANDVLLFGDVSVYRSTDAGRSWTAPDEILHACIHTYAFGPQTNTSIPAVYVGCDGGIGVSTSLADPTVALTLPASGYDDGATYDADSWLFQNLNHGRLASGLFSYASSAAAPAVGYIACGDTGIAAATGTPGWRGISGADSFAVATSPGTTGLTVWYDVGYSGGLTPYPVICVTDDGQAGSQTGGTVKFGTNEVERTTSFFTVDPSGLCLAGLQSYPSVGTLQTAITTTGVHTVTLSSTTGLVQGSIVVIDAGKSTQESVTLTAVSGSTVKADFADTHTVGAAVQQQLSFVGRIDRSGTVTQLSQDFQNLQPSAIAVSPVNSNLYVCMVWDESEENAALFQTTSGATANASTVWTQLGTTVPFASTTFAAIAAVTIDAAGTIYVLLRTPNATTGTPLYTVDAGGTWTAVPSSGAPTEGGFSPCVADPVTPNLLYAGYDADVYTVSVSGGAAVWTAITGNLPGQAVYDLWVGNVGTAAAPIVLLRCVVAGRGVYEQNVTANAPVPAAALYMRAHDLDVSWYPTVHDGEADVYDPSQLLYHYMSADIKVDPQVEATPPYFATDPETPPPISHVEFNLLSSNASNLPEQDSANVYVQVNNRSTTPQDVWVWAIFCAGAAGVAALNADPPNNNFAFWSQFHADGTIVPNLPAGSPWTSLGAPVQLTGVVAGSSEVAWWNWQIPVAQDGNHHCLVAFVNCANAPLSSTSYDVDSIVVGNRQVAQKNLTLVAAGGPIAPPKGPRRPPAPPGKIVILFNNPTSRTRVTSWHFDLRALDAAISAHVRVPELVVRRPFPDCLRECEYVEYRRDERERFRHVVRAVGGRRATIEDVELPPYGSHAVEIELSDIAGARGTEQRFHVQQVVDDRVVGGNLVIIVGEPVARPIRRPEPEEYHEHPPSVQLAPWIARRVKARQALLGRA
jgi:hypothetical protein